MARIGGTAYGLIGLERVRGIVVVDLDDSDSPSGRTLVVVANEITGTVSIYGT